MIRINGKEFRTSEVWRMPFVKTKYDGYMLSDEKEVGIHLVNERGEELTFLGEKMERTLDEIVYAALAWNNMPAGEEMFKIARKHVISFLK